MEALSLSAHQPNDLIVGRILFNQGVVEERSLVEAAFKLRQAKDGERFLELRIRRCGKVRYCIEFKYRYSGLKKDFHKFVDQIREAMRTKFGEKFKGWDISSHVLTIEW